MTDLEIIKHYQVILPCEQMVLTGSTALKYCGLLDKNSDIDVIIVNPTPATIDTLRRLQETYPAKTKPVHATTAGEAGVLKPKSVAESEWLGFIFMHEGVKVDVFISDKPIATEINASGIPLRPLSQIIARKKKASRMKDWIQLRTLSRMFFTEEEFKARLDCIKYQDVGEALRNDDYEEEQELDEWEEPAPKKKGKEAHVAVKTTLEELKEAVRGMDVEKRSKVKKVLKTVYNADSISQVFPQYHSDLLKQINEL